MRGFATYPEWAPGWEPPDGLDRLQHSLWPRSLEQPERWTVVVEAETRLVAVVSFGQARTARAGQGDPIPGLAHLGALFVDREWWGRGVGRGLLVAATSEIAARGYERARLIVPVGNERARELYRQNGWEAVGPWPDDTFGLDLLELRLEPTGRR